jgi:hypothetical protein
MLELDAGIGSRKARIRRLRDGITGSRSAGIRHVAQ